MGSNGEKKVAAVELSVSGTKIQQTKIAVTKQKECMKVGSKLYYYCNYVAMTLN